MLTGERNILVPVVAIDKDEWILIPESRNRWWRAITGDSNTAD